MADLKYRKIAEETIQISKQGYYFLNGKKVKLLKDRYNDFNCVKVFDTKKLESIQDDEDEFLNNPFMEIQIVGFRVIESDSFEAARFLEHPLVMNFANARHPGGGFLNGAHAQEETLCRCSTLYQSLNSEKAAEMYQYNSVHPSNIDSDYMLLSPNVCVFRDANYQLLEQPYTVAVWTIPALNLNGRARLLNPAEVAGVMKERLRKFFYAAARSGYRNLVLGAWGCGAFGHDAKIVASYFKELFLEERFCEFFDNVVFAILGQDYNLNAFEDAFHDNMESGLGKKKVVLSDMNFREAEYFMPICNHTKEIGRENIGYTQGLTIDGIPFEAELTSISNEDAIQIIFPEITEFYDEEDALNISNDNLEICGYKKQVEKTGYSVLQIGMVDNGVTFSLNTLQNYIDYFEKVGMIHFTDNYYNGAMWSLTDIEGNDLIGIMITLKENDMTFAECNLHFKPFPGRNRETVIHLVK